LTPVFAGNTTEVDASLLLGARIQGHVYTASGHQPVQDINVCAIDAAVALAECDSTDPEGGYLLKPLPAGAYKVAFSLEANELFPGEPEPDGWPTQFWNLKSSLSEADVINLPQSGLITGIDGLLGYVPPSHSSSSPPAGSSSVPPVVISQLRLRCKKGMVKRRIKGKVRCVRRQKRRHHRKYHHHKHSVQR
jgi:hypothetical protein